MSIELSKIQVSNTNEIKHNPQKVSFRETTTTLPNDTVELSTKNKGMSNGAKVASVLGAIGVIVGGILLHKHFSAKSATEAVQQTTKELSQAVRDLVTQGRITQKEAELFNQIHNLESEEFVIKAYELIAKDMGFEKYPKLIINKTSNLPDLAHTGEDITIYLKSYEREFGNNAKEELVNFIRHELEHYEQDLIMVKTKGEEAYKDAYIAGRRYRIADKARLLDGNEVENLDRNEFYDRIDRVLTEEAEKLGISNPKEVGGDTVLERIFEHETPIKLIRTLTERDWAKLHFTEEELARADEYLLSTRFYKSTGCFPQEYFLPNGEFDLDKIVQNQLADRIYRECLGRGYVNNPLELGAKQAGESLRDKFIAFMEAIK